MRSFRTREKTEGNLINELPVTGSQLHPTRADAAQEDSGTAGTLVQFPFRQPRENTQCALDPVGDPHSQDREGSARTCEHSRAPLVWTLRGGEGVADGSPPEARSLRVETRGGVGGRWWRDERCENSEPVTLPLKESDLYLASKSQPAPVPTRRNATKSGCTASARGKT